jgi:hypothetical protein
VSAVTVWIAVALLALAWLAGLGWRWRRGGWRRLVPRLTVGRAILVVALVTSFIGWSRSPMGRVDAYLLLGLHERIWPMVQDLPEGPERVRYRCRHALGERVGDRAILIDRVEEWGSTMPADPLEFVRLVNRLRTAGRETTLQVLAAVGRMGCRHEGFVVVGQALFRPRLQPTLTLGPPVEPPSCLRQHCLVEHLGVPWLPATLEHVDPGEVEQCLTYWREHCAFREQPLELPDDPLAAAEFVLTSPDWPTLLPGDGEHVSTELVEVRCPPVPKVNTYSDLWLGPTPTWLELVPGFPLAVRQPQDLWGSPPRHPSPPVGLGHARRVRCQPLFHLTASRNDLAGWSARRGLACPGTGNLLAFAEQASRVTGRGLELGSPDLQPPRLPPLEPPAPARDRDVRMMIPTGIGPSRPIEPRTPDPSLPWRSAPRVLDLWEWWLRRHSDELDPTVQLVPSAALFAAQVEAQARLQALRLVRELYPDGASPLGSLRGWEEHRVAFHACQPRWVPERQTYVSGSRSR